MVNGQHGDALGVGMLWELLRRTPFLIAYHFMASSLASIMHTLMKA